MLTFVPGSHAVGFSAFLTNRVVLNSPVKLVFDHVLSNSGNGYDIKTGIFTAPIAGLYSFSVTLTSDISSRFFIMFNGRNVGYVVNSGENRWESGSQNVNLQLTVGDKVWVNGLGKLYGFRPQCAYEPLKCYHSTFTGFLIALE